MNMEPKKMLNQKVSLAKSDGKMNSENLMMSILETVMSSSFMINMLKEMWKNSHSIWALSDLLGEVYNHMIIHKDGYGFEYYMTQIKHLYTALAKQELTPEQFDYEKSKTIAFVIANKLGIDAREGFSLEEETKIKDYYLQEYIVNGYVFHSFPEAYRESIMTQGLIANSQDRSSKLDKLQEIQKIFMDKGVVAPFGGYPYYSGNGIYYEHNSTNVFFHAVCSPEWFGWFTSADHFNGFQNIEKSPYILRDEAACRRNVLDLCHNAGLSEAQTKDVMQMYAENYELYSSPILNVGLIPKKVVGKDNISKAISENLNVIDTITYTMKDKANEYSEHQGNVSYQNISPQNIKISHLPEARTIISVNNYIREARDYLTNPQTNLAVLERVEENKNRLTSVMAKKVEETKSSLKKQIDINQTKKEVSQSQSQTNIGFDQRSVAEVETAQKIREKNMEIKAQKAKGKGIEKPKVKTLTKTYRSKVSNGYTEVFIVFLIVSFVAGALSIIITMFLTS